MATTIGAFRIWSGVLKRGRGDRKVAIGKTISVSITRNKLAQGRSLETVEREITQELEQLASKFTI